MTWVEFRWCALALFVGNALFSIFILVMAIHHRNESDIDNSNTVIFDNDPERTKLIETLAREHMNGLRSTTDSTQ